MRRLSFTLVCVCLLSTAVFAQAPASSVGLVVFETLDSGLAADAPQAGVVAGAMTTQTVLFVPSSAHLSRNLGLAIVNPENTATNVTMTLRRGGDGTPGAVKVVTVGARQQVSRFISELFPEVSDLQTNFDGSLAVTSDNPVAIVGLRFAGTNFSTTPITSLSPPAPLPQITAGVGGPDAVILPQFAAGGSWSSQIVLSNVSPLPLTVRVDLFKQDGTPLTTSFNGQSGSSFRNIVIPPKGIRIETNDDSGPLQVGYAIVTPIDNIAPTVTSTVPPAPEDCHAWLMFWSCLPNSGNSGVPMNQKVTATFSESMAPSTINASTFTLIQGITPISGTVNYVGTTAIFTPTVNLAPNTVYSATITNSARDIAGNPLAINYVWSFTTGAAPDTNPPTIVSVGPARSATGVALNPNVSGTFSKVLDPSTITTGNFMVKGPGATPVAGAVIYDAVTRIATFVPTGNLASGATFTATITTGVKDLAGNAPASNVVWSFSTRPSLAPSTVAPALTGSNDAAAQDDHNDAGPVSVGYAVVTPTAGVPLPGIAGGMVVFETFGLRSELPALQAGVQPATLTTRAVLFASAGIRLSGNVGIGMTNPGGTDAFVTMTLLNASGLEIATNTVTVAARQHVSRFISELFAGVSDVRGDFDGTLTVTSDTPVAIVALRFLGTKFSIIPITSLSPSMELPEVIPGIGGSSGVLLAQFVADGGWASEIVVLNNGAVPLTVRLDLFKQDGTPLLTALNHQFGSSFQNVVIAPGGIVVFAPRNANGDSDF